MRYPKFPLLVVLVAAVCGGLIAIIGIAQQQPVPVIRSNASLIEVYATVTDHKGKYVSGLTQDQFQIFDEGVSCPIFSFEPATSGFSCAILLDRTGSMLKAMPAVKNSIIKFIDSFRDNDMFAVYSFDTALHTLQEFTQDQDAAKQAVLHMIAQGATALFDSLSEVAIQLSGQKGKKVIVVFTDGADNSSYLDSSAVARRARSLGIPVHAIAQGDALKSPQLLKLLQEVGKASGGSVHSVRNSSAIGEVFRDITADLRNSYMIAYPPPEAGDARWRSIRVSIKGLADARIRAREGYYAR